MKDADYFFDLIVKSIPKPTSGYSECGSRVMPALTMFKALDTYEERRAFQDALERMLESPKLGIRRYAVDVCLGFFVFKDAI